MDAPIMIEGTPCCPICHEEATCEDVDVGAFTQQATPYVCVPCGWVQIAPILTEAANEQGILDEDLYS